MPRYIEPTTNAPVYESDTERRLNNNTIGYQDRSNGTQSVKTEHNMRVGFADESNPSTYVDEQGATHTYGVKKGSFADEEYLNQKIAGDITLGEARCAQFIVDAIAMLDPEAASRATITALSTGVGAYIDSQDPNVSAGEAVFNGVMNTVSFALPHCKFITMGKYAPTISKVLHYAQLGSTALAAPELLHVGSTLLQAIGTGSFSEAKKIISENLSPQDIQRAFMAIAGLKTQISNYRANKIADAAESSAGNVKAVYAQTELPDGTIQDIKLGKQDISAMSGLDKAGQQAYLDAKYSNPGKLVDEVPSVQKPDRKWYNPTGKVSSENKVGTSNPDVEFEQSNLKKANNVWEHNDSNRYVKADAKINSHNQQVQSNHQNAIELKTRHVEKAGFEPAARVKVDFDGDGVALVTKNGVLIPLKEGYGYKFNADRLVADTGFDPSMMRISRKKDTAGNVIETISIDGRKIEMPSGITPEDKKKMIELLKKYFKYTDTYGDGGSIQKMQDGTANNGTVGSVLGKLTKADIDRYNDWVSNHPWAIYQGKKGENGWNGGEIGKTGIMAGYHGKGIDETLANEEFKQQFPWFNEYLDTDFKRSSTDNLSGIDYLKKFYSNNPALGEYGSLPLINYKNELDDGESYSASMAIPVWKKSNDGSDAVWNVDALSSPIYSWSNYGDNAVTPSAEQNQDIPADSTPTKQQTVQKEGDGNQQPVTTPADGSNSPSPAPVNTQQEPASSESVTPASSYIKPVTKSSTGTGENTTGTTAPTGSAGATATANDGNTTPVDAKAKTGEDATKTNANTTPSAATKQDTETTSGTTNTSAVTTSPIVPEKKVSEVEGVMQYLLGNQDTGDWNEINDTGRWGPFLTWDITRPINASIEANGNIFANARDAKRYNVPTYKNNDQLKTVRLIGDLGQVDAAYNNLSNLRNAMSDYTSVDMDKNMNAMYGITDKGLGQISAAYNNDRNAFAQSERSGLETVDANRNSQIRTGNENQKIANDEITRRNKIDYNAKAAARSNMYEALEDTKDRYAKTRNMMNILFMKDRLANAENDFKKRQNGLVQQINNSVIDLVTRSDKFKNATSEEQQRAIMDLSSKLMNGSPINYNEYTYENNNKEKVTPQGEILAAKEFTQRLKQMGNLSDFKMEYEAKVLSRMFGVFGRDKREY